MICIVLTPCKLDDPLHEGMYMLFGYTCMEKKKKKKVLSIHCMTYYKKKKLCQGR